MCVCELCLFACFCFFYHVEFVRVSLYGSWDHAAVLSCLIYYPTVLLSQQQDGRRPYVRLITIIHNDDESRGYIIILPLLQKKRGFIQLSVIVFSLIERKRVSFEMCGECFCDPYKNNDVRRLQ